MNFFTWTMFLAAFASQKADGAYLRGTKNRSIRAFAEKQLQPDGGDDTFTDSAMMEGTTTPKKAATVYVCKGCNVKCENGEVTGMPYCKNTQCLVNQKTPATTCPNGCQMIKIHKRDCYPKRNEQGEVIGSFGVNCDDCKNVIDEGQVYHCGCHDRCRECAQKIAIKEAQEKAKNEKPKEKGPCLEVTCECGRELRKMSTSGKVDCTLKNKEMANCEDYMLGNDPSYQCPDCGQKKYCYCVECHGDLKKFAKSKGIVGKVTITELQELYQQQ